jgi:hypothetical protein
MAESTQDAPVLDLLASMTAYSVAASSLDPTTLMLVRIAALVAVDAPSASWPRSHPLSEQHASCQLQARSSTHSTSQSRSRRSRSKARHSGASAVTRSARYASQPGDGSSCCPQWRRS